MKDIDNCPGRFKCHGPASWCDQCGDVGLVCDDHLCVVHSRGNERRAKVDLLRAEFAVTNARNEDKRKELIEAVRELEEWRRGNPVMVARQCRTSVQAKAGLKQKQCGRCGLLKFPQELSDVVDESTANTRKDGTETEVKRKSPVCNKCIKQTLEGDEE
jgi:hypothetical protein